MSKQNEWKSKYLSSGIPLEFEVAKVLISKGFAVNSDYTYMRKDNEASGISKDFSVDIEATAYPPFDPNGNVIDANLTLLIDCKYRIPETKWLFLPEIDADMNDASGCSNASFFDTIRVVTEFSPFVVTEKKCFEFESKLPTCYKGVEIRLGSKDQGVFDAEIKHGIAQLRYAMPRLLREMISFQIGGHPDDNVPIIFSPILLTTADLFVFRENISIREIENAENVSDISDSVPYLILFSDYGPDFEDHCSREFKGFADLEEDETIINLEEKFRQSDKNIYEFDYPSRIGKGLSESKRVLLRSYFTQFFICNYHEFPNFIDKIKETISDMIKTRKNV